MFAFLQTWFEWLGSHTSGLLITSLFVVGGAWTFINIADEVKDGDTQRFDEWAVRSVRQPYDSDQPIGPAWVAEVARDLTALGGVADLTLVVAAVAGFLWLRDKNRAMWLFLIATVGGLLLSLLLKHYYHRPRPNLVSHLSQVYTSSFPSGHAMLSAVVYLTLGTLLCDFVAERRMKAYVLSVAMVLTFLVGISRVFMGVHYPTDVLAGWSAGLAWALLWRTTTHYLQRRGTVETNL